MKKLATLGLSVLLGVSCVFAGSPAAKRASGKPAARPSSEQMVVNPKGKTLHSLKHSAGVNANAINKSHFLGTKETLLKAPARVGASGSTVYGTLAYDGSGTYSECIAEVFADGTLTPVFELPEGEYGDITVNISYVRDGKMYCLADEIFWGMFVLGSYELVYDIQTGELISMLPYGEEDIMLTYAAYDPVNDTLYGYVDSSTGLMFCSAPGADPMDVTLIAQADAVIEGEEGEEPTYPELVSIVAMTFNQVEGKLIGIGDGGEVVEISLADGSQTVIANLEYPSSYMTAVCYSPLDEAYWYAVCTDTLCAIQLLNEDNFSVVSSVPYADLMEFCNFACIDNKKISESAPGTATLINTIFANGSLNGALTYRLPSLSYGGLPILGDVDWTLYVDGKEVKRGKAAAGSDVVVSLTELVEGNHAFKMVCSLGENEGKPCSTSFYVGNDTPVAPATVTLDEENITWTAVDAGVHGGYVNAEEVTYNVYLNDKKIAEGLTETTCASQLPIGETITAYVASVEAVFDGKVSEKANSNDIKYGEPYNIPVNFTPTAKESGNFTVVDANEDGNTIEFTYGSFGDAYQDIPVFRYNYSSREDADDWLFLPVIKFDDKDAVYQFSMNAFRTDSYTEVVEVLLCTAPDADSAVKTLIAKTNLENNKMNTEADIEAALNNYLNSTFTIPSAGNYYVGVHVVSPADQFRTFLRDFTVSKAEGISISAPEVVSNLKATAGSDGYLKATVDFVFPTKSIEGVSYASDKALEAVIEVDGLDEQVVVNGVAGERVIVAVPTRQGDNVISVAAKDGDLVGLPVSVSIYTGVENPGTVNNLTAVVGPDNYTAHLTWEAPTEGANGGYVEATGFTYYLTEYVTGDYGSGWSITKKIGVDVCEYDYTIPEGTAQNLVRVGIIAENSVGMADYLTSTSVVMGKPYELPVKVLNNQGSLLSPVVSYGTGWSLKLGDPADVFPSFATEDSRSAIYTIANEEMDVHYSLPKFSTMGCTNPAIKLNTYGGSASSISVVVNAYGIDNKVVKTIDKDEFTQEGPQYVVVELGSEFADKEWIEINLVAHTTEDESFIVYDYKVYDNIPYDFAILSIEGPAKAKIGVEAKYVAHVANYGYNANVMPASEWKLTDAEGNVIANITSPAGTDEIEPDGEQTMTISFTPTADQIGNLSLAFSISETDAANDDNNSLVKDIEVVKGTATVVTDLKVTDVASDNVSLAWTPVTAGGEVEEGFEEEATRDYEATELAGFKLVDGDGCDVYGPASERYSALEHAYDPQSFLVWSTQEMNDLIGLIDTFSAKSGDKFIIAYCPSEIDEETYECVPADDWLISPEIQPGSNFAFSIRPVIYDYGCETVEIMYSTTGDNPEDFQLLETLEIGVGGDDDYTPTWEDYEFSLPADAKYVAIHYISQDIYGIMIDDIVYSPAGVGGEVTGYDIVRNGEIIDGNAPCVDGVYDDATVEADTDYTYMVVPVINGKEKGLDSNVVNVRTTGIEGVTAGSKAVYAAAGAIVVNGYEGETIVVVSADGKVIANVAGASASERIEIVAGIYVVKAGKDVVKLIVK